MTHMAASRPLHLVLTVWGDAYIATFLTLCVPTLLADGNVPALSGPAPHRLRIFTPPADAERMAQSAGLLALGRHVVVEFVPIALPGKDDNKYHEITRSHLHALVDAREVGAAVVFLSPDFMLSDGTLRTLAAHSSAAAVVMVSPRVSLEGMARDLAAGDTTDPATAISLSPRALMALAWQHLHAVTRSQFWNAPRFSRWPSILYWQADEQTLFAHCFHPHPILLDPARLDAQFAAAMNTTIDGDLLGSLNAAPGEIHIVTESDELLILELSGPQMTIGLDEADAPASPAVVAYFGRKHANATNRALLARRLWYRSGPGDPTAQAASAARSDAVLADLQRRMSSAPPIRERVRALAGRIKRRLLVGVHA
jgi:hypothetical protein